MTFVIFLPETDDKPAFDPRAHTLWKENTLSKCLLIFTYALTHTHTIKKWGVGREIQKPIRKINSQGLDTSAFKRALVSSRRQGFNF